jgi:hypothetical protein
MILSPVQVAEISLIMVLKTQAIGVVYDTDIPNNIALNSSFSCGGIKLMVGLLEVAFLIVAR